MSGEGGRSSVVERKPSKLHTRVRFPSPAPLFTPDSISHRVIRTRGIGDRPEIDRRERTWKFDERRAAVRKSVVRPATGTARTRATMAALLDTVHVVAVAFVEIHVIIHCVRLLFAKHYGVGRIFDEGFLHARGISAGGVSCPIRCVQHGLKIIVEGVDEVADRKSVV